jgi:DNA-binding beta-propeller fold protein YncE
MNKIPTILGWVPLAFLAAAGGCFSNQQGVAPDTGAFAFPTAALITPGSRYLLVANSNFDLAWEMGTLVMVDLDRVSSMIEGCPPEGCEPFAEYDDFVIREETILIGSYASFMSLSPGGRRVYVTVRGNHSLTAVNLDEDGAEGRRISCFEPGSSPRKCDTDHVINRGVVDLPPDPYALSSDLDGWVFVSSLTSNQMTVFQVDPAADIERDIPPKLLYVDASFPESISWIKKHPDFDLFYAASRTTASVVTFRFVWDSVDYENEPRIYFGPSINMAGLANGNDARAVDFTPEGDLAFITNRSPNSLVIADTSPAANGWPANKVVGVVPLDQGPSLVKVWRPEGDDRTYVYATCYNADRVYVVDPFQRMKIDTIATGDGPHVFVTDPSRNLGYLVNFIESTVSVIDIDPDSEFFNRIRATLGKPKQVRRND